MQDKIIFHEDILEQLIEKYRGPNIMPKWISEHGGIMFGWKKGTTTFVIGIFFPPQKESTAVFCNFAGKELMSLRNSIDQENKKLNEQNHINIVGWIHTHPDIRVFISGTDKNTIKNLAKWDKTLTAVVVDPYKNMIEEIIGAWNSDLKKINLKINKIPINNDVEKALEGIKESIKSQYSYNKNILIGIPRKPMKQKPMKQKPMIQIPPNPQYINIIIKKLDIIIGKINSLPNDILTLNSDLYQKIMELFKKEIENIIINQEKIINEILPNVISHYSSNENVHIGTPRKPITETKQPVSIDPSSLMSTSTMLNFTYKELLSQLGNIMDNNDYQYRIKLDVIIEKINSLSNDILTLNSGLSQKIMELSITENENKNKLENILTNQKKIINDILPNVISQNNTIEKLIHKNVEQIINSIHETFNEDYIKTLIEQLNIIKSLVSDVKSIEPIIRSYFDKLNETENKITTRMNLISDRLNTMQRQLFDKNLLLEKMLTEKEIENLKKKITSSDNNKNYKKYHIVEEYYFMTDGLSVKMSKINKPIVERKKFYWSDKWKTIEYKEKNNFIKLVFNKKIILIIDKSKASDLLDLLKRYSPILTIETIEAEQ